ncbi:MAG: insulinase family protein [Bacteroidales bacterium]|nr:insulinase family protein [Bacteroidales bacterium]MDD2425976.1 insulinase family protein [Bacteroidales bacterium]MDD3989573.1 insulinase family protein [Bacteroidales bacterium]MDD4638632.1 insulinase family protein [Bacteroidales bacterium]
MNKIYLIAAVFLLSLPLRGQTVDLKEKLPVDESVRVGKLENGMTYFIKKNSTPAQRGEFFIVHNVGAHQETPEQNGLAHFLEHMAFNGTKNFPGKDMLNYLGKIGVRFGYNVNAYTSRERTVYNISDVPLIRESIIDSVLLAIHDWSYYITCDPQEIDKERGVIREEWRLSDNSRSRMTIKSNSFIYKNSKFGETTVIGTKEVIDTFKPATLVDFYHKWYRPDMQAVVLVGDFDVDQLEKKIKERFSSIPKAVNPSPKEVFPVPEHKEPVYGIVTDYETKASAVKLVYKRNGPAPEERLTIKPIYESVVSDLLSKMFQAKLDKVKDGENPPFKTSAAVNLGGVANLNLLQLTVSPDGTDFLKAIKGILSEVERVKEWGFDQHDFEMAKKAIEIKHKRDISKINNLKNADHVDLIVEHFTMGDPLTTIKDLYDVKSRILDKVTLEDVNAAIKTIFPDKNRVILVSGPESEKSKMPSEEEVMTLVNEMKDFETEPYESKLSVKEPIIKGDLKGSGIVSEKSWDKYGFKEWKLANGVKIYWYRNSEPNARFYMTAESKGGISKLDESRLPSAKLLSTSSRYFSYGGVTDKELKQYLTSKDASLTGGIGLNSESLSGGSNVSETETLFRMLYMYFTDAQISKENFDLVIKRQKEAIEKNKDSRYSQYRDSSQYFLYSGNIYKMSASPEDLEKATYQELNKIIRERFADASDFKFFISGPQSDEEIKELVKKYLGSLPSLNKQEKYTDRGVRLKKGVDQFFFYDDALRTPKAQISVNYHTDLKYNQKNSLTMYLLRYLLSERYIKSIREDKGGTYHVGVSGEIYSSPESRADLLIEFETDPTLKDILIKAVDEEIEDLAKNGPVQEEIKNALLYTKKNYSTREKKSDYWFGRFKHLIREGFDIYENEEQNVEKVTSKDIQKLAQKIYNSGNRLTLYYGTR